MSKVTTHGPRRGTHILVAITVVALLTGGAALASGGDADLHFACVDRQGRLQIVASDTTACGRDGTLITLVGPGGHVATAAWAGDADTLDGLDSSAFARADQAQGTLSDLDDLAGLPCRTGGEGTFRLAVAYGPEADPGQPDSEGRLRYPAPDSAVTLTCEYVVTQGVEGHLRTYTGPGYIQVYGPDAETLTDRTFVVPAQDVDGVDFAIALPAGEYYLFFSAVGHTEWYRNRCAPPWAPGPDTDPTAWGADPITVEAGTVTALEDLDTTDGCVWSLE